MPPLDLFGFKIDTYFRQYYLVWIVALLILIFTERALGMRLGRALRAIATSEIAAETLGVRTANWKLVAFVASAVFCAIAGALYAFTLSAITPSAFAFSAAILPIIMMLIGGGGSIWGGLVGAILMTWLSNTLSSTQQWSGVIYAIIMILLLLFLPMGITGLFTKQRLVSVKNAFRRQSRAETLECAAVAEADGSTGSLRDAGGAARLRARARAAAPGRRRPGSSLRRPQGRGWRSRARSCSGSRTSPSTSAGSGPSTRSP